MKATNNTKKKGKITLENDSKYDEIAAGGVVFFLDEFHNPKFLLLQHTGKNRHWGLPKGHQKKKESLKECAIREVSEETGIPTDKLILVRELSHKNIYYKKLSLGRKNKKIVHLYLFQALTKKVNLSHEHLDYKWVQFEDLVNKLTYPKTSLLGFVEALDYIKEL